MNLLNQPPEAKTPNQESGLVEWFLDSFWPRFGMQSVYVMAGIAIVVAGSVWYNNDRLDSQAKENKELGPAYIYYSEDKMDSAEAFLTGFVKTNHARLVQDKANLMLGQIYYNRAKYDEAIKAYGEVDPASKEHALVSSGALHGMAASYIQKKDYANAADKLEKLVATFQRKTGKPSEKVAGEEVTDLSPNVPNALWKLSLCYQELKNNDKAKATAQKLVQVYPESKEAFDATRFLAQLP